MANFDWNQYQAEDDKQGGGKFDWSQHEVEADPTWGDYGRAALGAVQSGLSKLDSYTGAPARAAVYSAETSPTELGRPGAAIRAFANQFGQDPSKAPTGEDIINAGGYVPPGSTAAKIGGFGADMLINPVNLIPVGDAAEGLAAIAKKGIAVPAQAISDGLSGAAGRLAVKATGATGKQAAEFAPNAGRELLERGLVKFGNDPAAVAANVQSAMDAAERTKQALISGPLKGATVSRNAIYNNIRSQIQALSGDESKLGVIKQLESKLEDIAKVGGQHGSDIPIAQSEDIRRGFDKAAKWSSSSDADVLEANKTVANAYRQAGEDAATAVDPKLGAQFKGTKQTQSLLIPVQEAAEKRALQLQQSPHGGLLDLAAVTGGAEVGGHIGESLGGPAGRIIGTAAGGSIGYGAKMLRPRYASMGAAVANGASKAVAAAPGVLDNVARPVAEAGARYLAVPGQPIPQIANGGSPQDRSPTGSQPSQPPARGPDAWAQSGLSRLGIQDQALSARLLADPKAKQLLIQASDLGPGSKSLKRIMDQIQKGWGQK